MTFAHLTLATSDVSGSAAFFAATLGWQPIPQPGNIDLTAAWLEIVPGQQLHLLEVENFEPSVFEHEFGRHFACFHSGSDFPALKERLVKHGATLVDAIRPTPFERFFFRDPNGYYFEIIDRDGYLCER